MELTERLQALQRRVEQAALRAGRDPGSVTLCAASKTQTDDTIRAAVAAGVAVFGENRVQELTAHLEADAYAGAREVHFIGRLQTNKVGKVVGRAALIHSVDTVSLAQQIEKEAAKKDQTVRILLEVNVAREESKWGFDPGSVAQAAREISAFPHVRILGLMTSAPYTEDPESNRLYFRELKELAGKLAAEKLLDVSDPDFPGPVLSMGMSGDFEVAVEEGATMVRVGSSIFGERIYKTEG